MPTFDEAVRNHQPLPLWPNGAPGKDEYPEGETPTITAYVLDDGAAHGAVIVAPGGGYSGRAPHEGAPIAQRLNQGGISAFVVDYRVAPVRHPYPSMDGMRALRWVRHYAQQLQVKPDHVGILGFSAGGHMASTVATHYDRGDRVPGDPIDDQPSRPDAAILCYAVISFEEFGHVGSGNNLLGPNAPAELRQSLCNQRQVTADTPPTFLWHTATDAGVPVENSLMFASACSAHKVPFALHVFPQGNHGLGLGETVPLVKSWPGLCCDWLKELGF